LIAPFTAESIFRIGEDDVRRLAAKLEREPLQVCPPAERMISLPTDVDPVKCDFVDVLVADDGRPSLWAAGHDVGVRQREILPQSPAHPA